MGNICLEIIFWEIDMGNFFEELHIGHFFENMNIVFFQVVLIDVRFQSKLFWKMTL